VSSAGILAVLLSMRLVRGWNQTGQKFAGSPDIVKQFLVPNPETLWYLILGTYAMVSVELMTGFKGIPDAISKPLIIGLVVSAVSFKLAFTNEDAPELVVGFAKNMLDFIDGPSLLARARTVFAGLALASAYPVYLLVANEGRDISLKRKFTKSRGLRQYTNRPQLCGFCTISTRF
jgi:ethanolaminephosphotransferase